MRRASLVIAAACIVSRVTTAAPISVLVMPWQPSVDAAAAEAAAIHAGFRVVAFDATRRELESTDSAQRDADSAIVKRVDDALVAAQQAFLDQRFGDMVTMLAPLDDALPVLGRVERRTVLWDVLFQRGLAHLMRHAAGDLEHARDRFLLALAISPERRPSRDVYGPDVERAFSEALAERDRRNPHAVALVGAPAGAHAIVDGTPVIDLSRPLSLRDGPHVVVASAIDFATAAWIADVHGETLAISLVPSHADALGAMWARGELGDDAIDALLGVATAHHANALLLVDRAPDHRARARVIAASGAGAWELRDTPAAAAAAALAWLGADGRVAAPAGVGETPLWHRHWVWVGAAAVVLGVVMVAVVLSRSKDDRIHVVAE